MSQPSCLLSSGLSPVWAPSGRHIAFSSWRAGNKEIYLMSLDGASDERALNLTNSPDRQEDNPVFNFDGSLVAFDDDSTGYDIVYGLPLFNYEIGGELLTMGQGRNPTWSPAGADFAYIFDQAGQTYLIASSLDGWSVAPQAFSNDGDIQSPDWSAMVLPRELPARLQAIDDTVINQLYVEVVSPGDEPPVYRLQEVAAEAPLPFLSDRVDDSFAALRQRVIEEAGWDFLANLDGMFEQIDAIKAGDLVLLSLSEEVGATTRYKWYGYCQITTTTIIIITTILTTTTISL